MATITAAGTGSGIDVENIITKLTEAERTPTEQRLLLRETNIQAEISAFGSLKSSLSDFRKSLTNLSSLQSLAARSATSSKPESFTVTADNTASVGSSQIEIVNLASAHKMVSTANFAGPTTAVGAGTMTISLGSASFNVQIVGGQNNTLAGIRDAINNATGNTGITASILTVSNGMGGTQSKLVLSADDTGTANTISVAVTGDSDGNDTDNVGLSAFLNANMEQKSTAANALIRVDGFDVTSSTNVFKNAIQGVTLTAVKANPTVNETLTVGINKTAIKDNLALFVENFNALSETLKFLTKYDPETQEAGLLTGDSTVRSIETQLRRTITNVVEGLDSNFSSLASLGITTQRDGTLKLDSTKLDSALTTNFDDVANLLGGEDGIAKKLDSTLNNFLKTGGLISTRNETFLKQLKDIDSQRERLELRMTSYEERLRAQYAAMDAIVANLNSTGDYVAQQMESISQITAKKK
ncbi:MAG TPA: flagellar filament capping protein FliD [Candidatus Kapabacteria bacterium]|nr:flagellar filament capping protein FliD [Candidatus Kapabacteria bacterium]